MGSKHSSNHIQGGTDYFIHSAPFDIQVPSSLRDPHESTFAIEQLERLNTTDHARHTALEYLHDDEKFASVWNSDTLHRETRRWMRKFIQIQTINAVCNGFYRLPDGTKIKLDTKRLTDAAINTKQYGNDHEYDTARQKRSYDQPAEVFVVNGDCLDTALCFQKKYSNCHPVVLNMANARTPGGGWRNGCGAQEENLHRRTNLFQCLEDSYHQLAGKRDWSYPIPEFGGIYSPDVSVFRGSEPKGYPFFPHGSEYVSFIACAAYSHPHISRNNSGELELDGTDLIENTKEKIKTILQIALDNNHDTVILSAFGCGAFRNPPRHIAKLFHKVISEEYSHSFKYIVFAIIDDHNSLKDHNPAGNIKPFADIFNVPIITLNELEN